jgi:hypothetical protein
MKKKGFVFLFIFIRLVVSGQAPYILVPNDENKMLPQSNEYADSLTTHDGKIPDDRGMTHYFHLYQMNLDSGDKIFLEGSSEKFCVEINLFDSTQSLGSLHGDTDVKLINSVDALQPINHDGKYLLGITSYFPQKTGAYSLKISIASAHACHPAANADFCERLSFLLAQKASKYTFVSGTVKNGDPTKKNVDLDLFGNGNQYLNDVGILSDVEYMQEIDTGKSLNEINTFFEAETKKLQDCLPNDWEFSNDIDKDTQLSYFSASRTNGLFDEISIQVEKADNNKYYLLFTY